jgi:UDP-N-acetylmuramyl pentapeptide phosphotransferase/UDP-N-acetylglucosamine-1-phosphate transferase
MLDIILTGSVAFIITFLAIPVVLQIADQKKLYDVPDERKIHKRPVSSLGGIGIFTGFILAALLSISVYSNPEFQYFFATAMVIFFLGLKDDIIILSASKKFIGQIIAAAILIHLGGMRLTSMHGLFGIHEISESFSLAISYLTIIVVMNSFNLIDGVDGLAATLGTLTLSVFGFYFYMVDQPAYALLAFSLAGSLLAFLIFNHQPAKIFMGDSGSLIIGLINSIMVIKFINVADSHGVPSPLGSVVAIGFAILMVPLFDTLRVFAIRIYNGRSPFTPDRNHVHHLMLDKGMSHARVTLCCLAINMIFIAGAYFGQHLGSTYLLLIMFCAAFTGIGILYYSKQRSKLIIATTLASQPKTAFQPSSKVVSISQEQVVAEKN